jgi:hypothetical protein
LLTGMSLSSLGTPIYGGMLSKQLLGPISIGVWGLSNATGGFALGISF